MEVDPKRVARGLWWDRSWNPITGCTPCSEGCDNCYAQRMAKRLAGRHGYPKYEPFRVTVHADKLHQPDGWRSPRRIFACSMGDLWHPDITPALRAPILQKMEDCNRHTYLLLTKRPEWVSRCWPWIKTDGTSDGSWPRNIWLGVTAENQRRADQRIPLLLKIPAAVRFVSCEPLLNRVDLTRLLQATGDVIDGLEGWTEAKVNGGRRVYGIDWLIIGCETGPGRRPCRLEWGESLIDQADAASVPVFVKQLEIDGRVSKDPGKWPAWARRREFPTLKEST